MSWFSVNHVADEAFVVIDDAIGNFGIGFEEFAAAFGNPAKVWLTLDCPGGNCDIAEKIFNLLKGRDVEILINRAESAGFIVMLCGKRKILRGGSLMTHKSVTTILGDSDYLRQQIEVLESLDARLNRIIAQELGQPIGVVEEWHRGETYWTAEEALAAGLVDEVVEVPVSLVGRIPKALEVSPDSDASTKAPTEQEKLFAQFLTAFGKVAVSNKSEFGDRLRDWFLVNVITQA